MAIEIEGQRGGAVEVRCYGVLDFEADSVEKDIRALEPSSVNLRVNSPGGDARGAVALYNAMRRLSDEGVMLTSTCSGLAASAASLLYLAGDHRTLEPGAAIMVHQSWGMSVNIGDAGEVRAGGDRDARALEAMDEGMLQIYASRTGAETDTIRQWLAAETWFTGDAAHDAGFSTGSANPPAGRSSEQLRVSPVLLDALGV